MYPLKEAESIPIKTASKSIPAILCLSAVGAFVGLEKVVERRLGKKSMGFVRPGELLQSKEKQTVELLQQMEPDDLVKFGMIPEFVGRIPVMACLESLDEEALISILTKPRNALVKQYQKLLKMDKRSTRV